ncbi:molecular chaperone GrpE [Leifsonia xyli subsp. xyli]|uniref:Protein GrpE n=2 Tax=Leifsonia xyli subsp. xyli TaxID=59736 RepID=GRPE_LEIXX|nr:nucleotide exchange factor GrpE [Leifsonia xyli]Q6AC77.1 RecName: Full=Protein GrpE; AltName: Full=HSP-70 cofactor [Leifsonia xyli subsp. xyli str. CTCB07]AAT90015.1 molecular chaperone GrpE [Leifsonia xyli subsp. xyli str. CTCB07]ODA90007.1 molecular chaperone GrpE [Leifsonia xyli subsp. xyli]
MSDQNLGQGSDEPEREEPIVRDKRRIDPETGKVREPQDLSHEELVDVGPAGESQGEEILSDDDLDLLSGQTTADQLAADQLAADQLAAERLADLQRVTAEYANYRKRTESNREIERERAIGDAVKGLIPVLDDLERADTHGDLIEGSAFATIAAKLRASVERLGLLPYGEKGEPFDPQIHEAIFQQPTPGVTADTVADVVETGYRLGSTTVRVAKVVVAVPA